ncbi:MAG: 2,3,4,5-tetrahydropyridine-2,6-dicarboxylate N-succinyltransferase [Candidatus Cloacimonadota bacterium]|nr:MAG: 2,3,4,5-tetrahydropyridine-2,6-dicarboxylate N-succinyltransferase [Candidatus Cloacimonadota bacterium]
MKEKILEIYHRETNNYTREDLDIFDKFKAKLEKGEIRAAEKKDGVWTVNAWVKKGILLGFKIGKIVEMKISETKKFTDKSTYPERNFSPDSKIRMVPGGSSVRSGAYIAPGVTMMPPMYVNAGAYVDSGSMIDSHALVGSCAQIGKNVHLSAGAMIGGVLEPVGARPVIIEDNVFAGGNSGIYEGVTVKEGAIIAAGVIITSGMPIYDAVAGKYLEKSPGKPTEIPENAVVVAGTRPLKSNKDFSVYCPIIIKYRDQKSDLSVILEDELR